MQLHLRYIYKLVHGLDKWQEMKIGLYKWQEMRNSLDKWQEMRNSSDGCALLVQSAAGDKCNVLQCVTSYNVV